MLKSGATTVRSTTHARVGGRAQVSVEGTYTMTVTTRVGAAGPGLTPYMLNTREEEKNPVLYSYLACGMNTVTLDMYVLMSYTGLHRYNTLFVFLWLRHRNT